MLEEGPKFGTDLAKVGAFVSNSERVSTSSRVGDLGEERKLTSQC